MQLIQGQFHFDTFCNFVLFMSHAVFVEHGYLYYVMLYRPACCHLNMLDMKQQILPGSDGLRTHNK